MAQPTNTYDTYAAKGIREDLHDIVYMISPEKTPVSSMIKKFTAEQTFHEWMRDRLDPPSANNAVIYGDDRVATAVTPADRVGNYIQLMDKAYTLTDINQMVNSVGKVASIAQQRKKKSVELKRDVEARLLSKLPAVPGNSTNAAQMSGIGAMLYTNALHGAGGSTPAHTSGAATVAPTAGTNRALTQAFIEASMQSIFNNSGEQATVLSCTPSHKVAISAMPGNAANRLDLKNPQQAKIIAGADLYISNFGTLTIMPNYVQTTAAPNTVYIINPEEMGIATLRNGGYEKLSLAKTGHAEKEMFRVHATVAVTNERAHAKIDDLIA